MNEDHLVTLKGGTRKKRALKKCPDAPKRFRSAYICFLSENLEKAKSNIPNDAKVTDVMKELANNWRSLPQEEKNYYEIMAQEDKIRYYEELSNYTGPMKIPNKRKRQEDGHPKRAMSAFLSFSQEVRCQIRNEFPNLKNSEVSKLLGERWRQATEEEKKPHIERELREREKYYENMATWREEVGKAEVEKANNQSENNSCHGIDQEFEKNGMGDSTSAFWEQIEVFGNLMNPMTSNNKSTGFTSQAGEFQMGLNPKAKGNRGSGSTTSSCESQGFNVVSQGFKTFENMGNHISQTDSRKQEDSQMHNIHQFFSNH